jgi:hypothetical protein
MVRTASLFSQLLQQFPREEFETIVHTHGAEYNAKGFRCWTQFVSMLFCHLAHADSLREICNGLRCCMGKLKHVGILKAPNKSTLAYANEHRPAHVYEDLFYHTLDRFRRTGQLGHRKSKFRFKNKLLSLDSTTLSLCIKLFPWAEYKRTKGGVKVHVLLDHDYYMPSFVHITPAKYHDLRVVKILELNPGSIVVMDRAYNDYNLFSQWTQHNIFFVTRLKDNAVYEVIEDNDLPKRRNILADQIIALSAPQAQKEPLILRRIVVWDEEHNRVLVLLTNHFGFGATTIAAIYKERWEIELFFKALKQNLKIKSFVGTSENALLTQIWTALLALLLLKWLHYLSQARWSFSNLVSLLRLNLFTYRNIIEWLHQPYTTEPIVPAPLQFVITIPGFGQPSF